MKLSGQHLFLLAANLVMLVSFSTYFILSKNYEFIIYVGVIIALLSLIFYTKDRVHYPILCLWGLTLWALMHMAGGTIYLGGTRLYELILIPISDTYEIFKYDQFVHILGFGIATYIFYGILRSILRKDLQKWTALSIIVVMVGLGIGALNEVIEFFITVIAPSTGVGGYINTSLDLVADLIGAICALIIIRINERRKMSNSYKKRK